MLCEQVELVYMVMYMTVLLIVVALCVTRRIVLFIFALLCGQVGAQVPCQRLRLW